MLVLKILQLSKYLNNLDLFNQLYLTNFNNEKIYLSESIDAIIKHLSLPLNTDDYKNLSCENIKLLKLQLWLEENLLTINYDLIYNISFKKLLTTLRKKVKFISSAKVLKKITTLKEHELNYDSIIILVIASISYFHFQNKSIPQTNFTMNIANNYIYRYLYYPLISKESFMTYSEYLDKNHITPDVQLKFGTLLLEPFIQLNLIESRFISNDEKYANFLFLSDDMVGIIESSKILDHLSIPMIYKPLDWKILDNGKIIGGNYRSDISQLSLVHLSSFHDHKIENLKSIIDNINYLQSQKLCVNKIVLDNLEKLNITWDKYNLFVVELAHAFKDIDFYIPIYIDWRGRIYTSSHFLSYQGNELSKSLVLLKSDIPINNDGIDGLILTIASSYGHSDKSNDYKIRWFNNNKDDILSEKNLTSAKDKLDYFNYCTAYDKIMKNEPINVNLKFDATCSGIQHISALLEDEILGKQVNIKSTNDFENPEDLYSNMIDDYQKAIVDYCDTHNEDNVLLKLKINRNFIKKPIMTIPYSVSIHGIAQQILSQGKLSIIGKNHNYIFKSIDDTDIIITYKQVFRLSTILYSVVIKKFPALVKIFNYYKKMVSLLVKHDLPIKWNTPSGVTICQNYNKLVDETIKFRLERRYRSVVLRSPAIPKKINNIKSQNAIVPNIIHSLDSNHLNKIVKHFIDMGYPIATVHDCFIIHPNHWLILRNAVVDKYIELYSDQKFIQSYHNECIELFKSKFRLSEENSHYIIVDTGEIIPDNPYISNDKFFVNLRESKYLIK